MTDTVVAHGHPRATDLDSMLMAATRELIVPGCTHLGMATDDIVRWLDAGAPTD